MLCYLDSPLLYQVRLLIFEVSVFISNRIYCLTLDSNIYRLFICLIRILSISYEVFCGIVGQVSHLGKIFLDCACVRRRVALFNVR